MADGTPSPAAPPADPQGAAATPPAAAPPEPAPQDPPDDPGKETPPADPGEGGKETPPAAEGPPEQYEAFAVPEDFKEIGTVLQQKGVMDHLTAQAKEMGWTQDQAQKGVEFTFKTLGKIREAAVNEETQIQAGWLESLKKEPQLAGDDGSKLDETLSTARKVVDTFSSPAKDAEGNEIKDEQGNVRSEMSVLLDETGYGNHPAVVKFLHALSKEFEPDRFLQGKPAGGAGKSTASVLYGDTKKG